MRQTTIAITLSFALASGAALSAQTAPQAPPSGDHKPTETSPAAFAGKWTMTVDTQSNDQTSTLELKIDSGKVSGTATTASGQYAIAGELKEGKLTFGMEYQNLHLAFNGALNDKGMLEGTMDYGQGPIAWRAERVKEK